MKLHFNPKKFSIRKFFKRYRLQLLYLLILLITFLLLVPPATYLYFAKDLKDKQSIMSRNDTGLTLLTRDGQPFFTFYAPKKITYVQLSDIPNVMQEATVASEDKDFYQHSGFSVRAIGRAFLANLFAGKIVEGGSTITQELAKNAFLSSSRNYLRKYQEIVLAAELERRFSKQDILEVYLNSVYFGEGAFGIENAAETYFGVHAKQLTLPQAALLVGLLPAPSAYSPLSNGPQKALERRTTVLQDMLQQGYITQTMADDANADKPQFTTNKPDDGLNELAPHFALYVKDQVIKQYGEERVIREGFNVTTTLNKTWQQAAENVVKAQVTRLKYDNASNGAAVAIDPKTGEIEVMVGSYDWNDPSYGKANMALYPRQPGSSFKPIIYGTALEEKLITPATVIDDDATTFPGNYQPQDYDRQYHGYVTVRHALSNSMNIPAVKVMQQVGVAKGLEQAKNFGISTLNDPSQYGLSLVLGAGEVPLLELTDAYAVFANNGVYHQTKSILKIENKYNQVVDDTQTDWWKKLLSMMNPFSLFQQDTTTHKVLSPEASFLISSILSDNIARAQVFGSALTISRPAAVKTGTTDSYKDALTVGYTPSLVVGVWVGNNDDKAMDNIAGSLGAAPIWRSLMESFLAGTPVEHFTQPTFVISQTVCSPYFAPYKEFFITGTQPTSCETAEPTQQPTISSAPTATTTPVPSSTPQPTPTATPYPTATPTPTTIVQPLLTPTITPLPSPSLSIPNH